MSKVIDISDKLGKLLLEGWVCELGLSFSIRRVLIVLKVGFRQELSGRRMPRRPIVAYS